MLPSILNDSTAFWLDFEGSRLLETSKINKKMHWEISVFFSGEKSFPGAVFLRVGVHFGISFRARSCNSGTLFLSQCVKSQEFGKLRPDREKKDSQVCFFACRGPFWDQFSRPELQFGLAFSVQMR